MGSEAHSFNPETEVTHFTFLENEQRSLLSDAGITGDALNRHAHWQALVIFNTVSLPQNVKSVLEESDRLDEIPGAYEIRNGQLYAEGFGTLDTMLERTKKEKPELYNADEAQMIKQAARHLINGDGTAVAYSMYHENGTRYVPVMERIGDMVYLRSIDIGKVVGRDLHPAEAKDVIVLLQKNHTTSSRLISEDSPFPLLVLHETLSTAEVQKTALSRSLISTVDKDFALRTVVDKATSTDTSVDTKTYIPDYHAYTTTPAIEERTSPAVTETSTVRNEMTDTHDKSQNKLKIPYSVTSVAHRVFRDIQTSIHTLREYKRPTPKEHLRSIEPSPSPRYIRTAMERGERRSVGKLYEPKKEIIREVSRRYADFTMLTIIAKTSMAPHAGIFLLRSLSKELPAPVKPIEKSIQRHERKLHTRQVKAERRTVWLRREKAAVRAQVYGERQHVFETKKVSKKHAKERVKKLRRLEGADRGRAGNRSEKKGKLRTLRRIKPGKERVLFMPRVRKISRELYRRSRIPMREKLRKSAQKKTAKEFVIFPVKNKPDRQKLGRKEVPIRRNRREKRKFVRMIQKERRAASKKREHKTIFLTDRVMRAKEKRRPQRERPSRKNLTKTRERIVFADRRTKVIPDMMQHVEQSMEKRTVRLFSFSLLLLMSLSKEPSAKTTQRVYTSREGELYTPIDRTIRHTPVDAIPHHQHAVVNADDREQKKQTQDHESVWVLLSIILIMSMIREQGISQSMYTTAPATKKRKKKTKKKNKTMLDTATQIIPANGIIFTYHS